MESMHISENSTFPNELAENFISALLIKVRLRYFIPEKEYDRQKKKNCLAFLHFLEIVKKTESDHIFRSVEERGTHFV